MTLRHKLADWISGGELTRLRSRVDGLIRANDQVWDRWSEKYTKLDAARAELRAKDKALRSIANNTCCEGCQEAARVAKAALYPDDMSRTTIGQAAIAREALE